MECKILKREEITVEINGVEDKVSSVSSSYLASIKIDVFSLCERRNGIVLLKLWKAKLANAKFCAICGLGKSVISCYEIINDP